MKNKILVVACDGGGAEIVSAYVKEYKDKYNFICYAYGPAKIIFKRKKIFFRSSLEDVISINKIIAKNKNVNLVIAGTSGSSMVEINFIKIAKEYNIKTVSYLDHWVNYKERFSYPKNGWKNCLPDEIWVGDALAFNLAKKIFPDVKIKFVENQYFKQMVFDYKKLKKSNQSKTTILFISEPVNGGNVNFNIKLSDKYSLINECDVLNRLILSLLKNRKYNKLIIRLHPSDDKNKYNYLLLKYLDKFNIRISKNKLVNDLRSASLVVGMESTALVVAYLCGKKVISVLPKRKKIFILPVNVTKIKKIKDLDKFIE